MGRPKPIMTTMKAKPETIAMIKPWTARSCASVRDLRPVARATAAAIPPPMPPAASVCIKITNGKTKAKPPSAAVPILPAIKASNVFAAICEHMTRVVGQASRAIGPIAAIREAARIIAQSFRPWAARGSHKSKAWTSQTRKVAPLRQ